MKEKELLAKGYKKYSGEGIDVYWNPEKCSHAGKCAMGNIEIFSPTRKPWIKLEGHDPDEIASIIDCCPSEALLYLRK
ncbi:MAG: (4Fe-4S)-binding protein [Anaerovoracaceae bacterium]|jgi:uncharacterized Fe-S cluster protein YjdI